MNLKFKEAPKKIYDIIIVGSGPAGLAAAIRCSELGVKDILLIERDCRPGGILPQCIHSGFGLKIFNRDLTGPQYCQIFVDRLKKTAVEVVLDTMVLSINTTSGNEALKANQPGAASDKHPHVIGVVTAGKNSGFRTNYSKALILALGCRERQRGQIMIPGAKPSGIFTAGLAQRMVNIEGYLPGREIVILGSGDIGLIMARRLALEGCRVKGVFELMPFSTGLLRNISQCLEDFNIPLYLSHTATNIIGARRLEAVQVCRVDKNLEPDPSSKKTMKCDTLLLAVGLIPENELSKSGGITIDKYSGGPVVDESFQTSVPGIFTCGNSLFVYDLVDNVTEDGYRTAESAVEYILRSGNIPASSQHNYIDVCAGENVAYAVPQKITGIKDVTFKLRSKVPVKNATVEFEPDVHKKKFKYITPGEMVFFNVKKQAFAECPLPSRIKVNIKGDMIT